MACRVTRPGMKMGKCYEKKSAFSVLDGHCNIAFKLAATVLTFTNLKALCTN